MSWNPKFLTGDVISGTHVVLINNFIDAYRQRRARVSGVPFIPYFSAGDLLDYLATVQSSMTTLISRFVDHTFNSGNYAGETSIPHWNSTSLMAHLGESRLPAPATADLINDWLMQQYRIINLLRWISRNTNTSTPSDAFRNASTPYAGGSPTAGELATHVSDWASSSWGAGSGLAREGAKSGYSGGFINSQRTKLNHRITYTYSVGAIEVDVYDEIFNGNGGTLDTTELGGNYNPGEFAKMYGDLSITFSGLTIIQVGDIEAIPNKYASSGSFGWGALPNGRFVLKFDGVNGFTFKDW